MWHGALKRGMGSRNVAGNPETWYGIKKCAERPRNAASSNQMRSGNVGLKTCQWTCVFYTGEDQKLQSPLQHFQKAKGLAKPDPFQPHPARAFFADPPPKSKRVWTPDPFCKGLGRCRPMAYFSSMMGVRGCSKQKKLTCCVVGYTASSRGMFV